MKISRLGTVVSRTSALIGTILTLFVACSEQKRGDGHNAAPNPNGSSLVDDAPIAFEEISQESLVNGKSFSLSDRNLISKGFRFSLQRNGILRINRFVNKTSCNGDVQLSIVLRGFDNKGSLNKDILVNFREDSEYSIEPGSFGLVISRSSQVSCTQFDVSFDLNLKINPTPTSGAGDTNSRKIEFEGYSYIQEIVPSPNEPDTGAMFIIRASDGKIQSGIVRAPAFIKEYSVGELTRQTLEKLFSFSSVTPVEQWKIDLLSKYEGSTFLYFRKYPVGLCDGQDHEIEFQFKDSAGRPHTAVWQFLAYRGTRAECALVKSIFIVQS